MLRLPTSINLKNRSCGTERASHEHVVSCPHATYSGNWPAGNVRGLGKKKTTRVLCCVPNSIRKNNIKQDPCMLN